LKEKAKGDVCKSREISCQAKRTPLKEKRTGGGKKGEGHRTSRGRIHGEISVH